MMERLDRISVFLNRILVWGGGFFLAVMILLTCSNIVLRVLWVPLRGTFELMGFCGAVVAACGLGYTQLKNGHIAVDVLVAEFRPRIRKLIRVFNSALSALFFAVVSWQVTVKAVNLLHTNEVSETLRIPYYPFTFAVALGCMALAFTFVIGSIRAFNSLIKEDVA